MDALGEQEKEEPHVRERAERVYDREKRQVSVGAMGAFSFHQLGLDKGAPAQHVDRMERTDSSAYIPTNRKRFVRTSQPLITSPSRALGGPSAVRMDSLVDKPARGWSPM